MPIVMRLAGDAPVVFVWFLVLSVVVSWSDHRHGSIPNRFVLPSLVGFPMLQLLSVWMSPQDTDSEQRRALGLIAVGIGCGMLLGMCYLSFWHFGVLGGGDVKLAVVVGEVTGFVNGVRGVIVAVACSWLLLALQLAFIRFIGSLPRALPAHRARDPASVAFAPTMLLGAWVSVIGAM